MGFAAVTYVGTTHPRGSSSQRKSGTRQLCFGRSTKQRVARTPKQSLNSGSLSPTEARATAASRSQTKAWRILPVPMMVIVATTIWGECLHKLPNIAKRLQTSKTDPTTCGSSPLHTTSTPVAYWHNLQHLGACIALESSFDSWSVQLQKSMSDSRSSEQSHGPVTSFRAYHCPQTA